MQCPDVINVLMWVLSFGSGSHKLQNKEVTLVWLSCTGNRNTKFKDPCLQHHCLMSLVKLNNSVFILLISQKEIMVFGQLAAILILVKHLKKYR